MKWTNKGHEYDAEYKEIKGKKAYYLFGAGDYGRQFLNIFKDEIRIRGFIDNSEEKQGKAINGYICYTLDQIQLSEDEGIVLTMSQIARITPCEQLKQHGYRERVDFFVLEEFLSVYYVYKYDKIYFSSISFLPSTICNLKCRHCLNFNPFAKQFYVREWEALVKDVDLFFSCIDRIMIFHISGGEPMLYKHTVDLIEYIDKNYGDRIDTLRMITNGTIVPRNEDLIKISKCRVELVVDDYREAVPRYNAQFNDLTQKLEEFGIRFYINKADNWIDLAPERTDYSCWTEEALEKHRSDCCQSWQELRDGKLYNCNYAAYASVAGIGGKQDQEETYELTTFSTEKKKELVEFRLGYTTKGYTNFCRKCRGFTTENFEMVSPAVQV